MERGHVVAHGASARANMDDPAQRVFAAGKREPRNAGAPAPVLRAFPGGEAMDNPGASGQAMSDAGGPGTPSGQGGWFR